MLAKLVGTFLFPLLVMFVVSCDRKPTASDHVDETMAALETYLFKSAEEAEGAMLNLEKVTLDYQKRKVRDIDYHGHLAAINSRLYRVRIALGKTEAAATNFNLASNYLHKHYAARGAIIPSAEEMPGEIEGVDRYFGIPAWKN